MEGNFSRRAKKKAPVPKNGGLIKTGRVPARDYSQTLTTW